MRQVKVFKTMNHDSITGAINKWLVETNSIAISIAVEFIEPWWHAFVIYESGNSAATTANK